MGKKTRQTEEEVGKKKKQKKNGEWTGLGFAKFQRAVKNRDKRRKLVSKSSLVPQRPSRLRDK